MSTSPPKRRRADAERNIASILDAALAALASDPDASMAEIARRAGVVRATIYMHFPTREALLDAVQEHATAQVADAIRQAEPDRGEPEQALERVIRATWMQLSQFHGILSLNMSRLSAKELHRRHLPMTTQFIPLLERGQANGVFRSDVSAEWLIAVVRAIVHVASTELQAGRLSQAEVERTMVTTALNAVRSAVEAFATRVALGARALVLLDVELADRRPRRGRRPSSGAPSGRRASPGSTGRSARAPSSTA